MPHAGFEGPVAVQRPATTGGLWNRNPTMSFDELEWEYRHDACLFHNTHNQRGFYLIHPDWVSESFNPPTVPERARKPWPYEFPGARAMHDPKWDLPFIRQAWKAPAAIAEIDRQLHRPRAFTGSNWTSVGTLHFNGRDPTGFKAFNYPDTFLDKSIRQPWAQHLPTWNPNARGSQTTSGGTSLPSLTGLNGQNNGQSFKTETNYRASQFDPPDIASLRLMSGRYMSPVDS
ncbi:uncharacterized protein LOC106178418 [Lingula anatina]|uniref:Uncharacterized protein LOC106178418 n=1 Tax=Lingula anatina TaxID=7574 RepID=A0A1S3K326_LINAN|nr:uncharacterized protein LOC106178418 [Lingula anatina]|eukprot:XP_013417025.1 uncharacterized protein LOC106178418 [Lingula anatina]